MVIRNMFQQLQWQLSDYLVVTTEWVALRQLSRKFEAVHHQSRVLMTG
jgi:hypothetical protein